MKLKGSNLVFLSMGALEYIFQEICPAYFLLMKMKSVIIDFKVERVFYYAAPNQLLRNLNLLISQNFELIYLIFDQFYLLRLCNWHNNFKIKFYLIFQHLPQANLTNFKSLYFNLNLIPQFLSALQFSHLSFIYVDHFPLRT